MKKYHYFLAIALFLVGGLAFTTVENKNETAKKAASKPLIKAEKSAAMKNWEATPEGKSFREWEASSVGKKVQYSATKISKPVKEFANMEGTVTSLTLPPGSRLGYGVMVKIDVEEYILAFGPEFLNKKNTSLKTEYDQLHSLKLGDKIIIRSHNVSKAPKYSYAIIAGDYVERDGKVIYKKVQKKGAC